MEGTRLCVPGMVEGGPVSLFDKLRTQSPPRG